MTHRLLLGVVIAGVSSIALAGEPRPGPSTSPIPSTPVASPRPMPSSSITPIVTAGEAKLGGSSSGWEPMGEVEDGIRAFRREVPGSSIVALRGEGPIPASLTRVASVILDDDRAHEWVDSVEKSYVLRMIGEREFIDYTHLGMPPLVKDREFINHGFVEADIPNKMIVVRLEPLDDDAQAPKTGYVRGSLTGYWRMQAIDAHNTYMIAEMHGDPKGGLPKWLVNLFQKSWPRNTIESLRKQVAKGDIKIQPQVKAAFGDE